MKLNIEKKDCIKSFVIGSLMFIFSIIFTCFQTFSHTHIGNGNIGAGTRPPNVVCLGVGIWIMYESLKKYFSQNEDNYQ